MPKALQGRPFPINPIAGFIKRSQCTLTVLAIRSWTPVFEPSSLLDLLHLLPSLEELSYDCDADPTPFVKKICVPLTLSNTKTISLSHILLPRLAKFTLSLIRYSGSDSTLLTEFLLSRWNPPPVKDGAISRLQAVNLTLYNNILYGQSLRAPVAEGMKLVLQDVNGLRIF
jgi:hypothetical protein